MECGLMVTEVPEPQETRCPYNPYRHVFLETNINKKPHT